MTADPAVLRRAADVIREGGLSKGLYRTLEGRHCTVGALGEARGVMTSGGFPMKWEIREEMALVAEVAGTASAKPENFEISDHERGIYAWNDHPATTAADVIAVFETAAEKIEADR